MLSFSNIIDLDADPFIPVPILSDCFPKDHPARRISVAKHRRIGRLAWDPKKIWLYRAPNQTDSNPIYGHYLWDRDLVYRHVLNANLLDYLFNHQDLIPEDWKPYKVCFWGTQYKNECDPPSNLLILYLFWDFDKWQCGCRRLNQFFGNKQAAVILDY